MAQRPKHGDSSNKVQYISPNLNNVYNSLLLENEETMKYNIWALLNLLPPHPIAATNKLSTCKKTIQDIKLTDY